MYTLELSVHIDRPPEEIFEFATNPANVTQWQSGAESGRWTSELPPGVGSTYEVVTRFLGLRVEATLEITGWDPPNRYSMKSIDIPFPIAATWTFEPREEGTQVTLDGQVEARGILKPLEGLLGRQAEKQDGRNLNALKQLMEAQPG